MRSWSYRFNLIAVWTGTKPVKSNLVIHSGPIFYILRLFFLSPLGGQNCPPLEDKRFNKTYGKVETFNLKKIQDNN